MVRKAEGTWRLCVDSKAFNEHTVSYRFLIPVVGELLEKLHVGQFFSMLDLHLGNHQILRAPEDVPKRPRWRSLRLYEFLVTSFGLTNSPTMFQDVMNDVLQPFLHQLVLVLFDDILIYSSSWADLLYHVRMFLFVLRA